MAAKGKLRITEDGPAAWCPGCKQHHIMYSGRWQFNGDFDRPTFSPSLLISSGGLEAEKWLSLISGEGGFFERHICHSFIRDGQWQFLGDCTHELAGKTVPLRDEENILPIS